MDKNCGETGIRTLEGLPPTRFPGVRLKPLGHLSLPRWGWMSKVQGVDEFRRNTLWAPQITPQTTT